MKHFYTNRHRYQCLVLLLSLIPSATISVPADEISPGWHITSQDNSVEIKAGMLSRHLQFHQGKVSTTHLKVDGNECLAGPAREFSLTVTLAEPNRKPKGLLPEQSTTINTTAFFAPEADSMSITTNHDSGVRWVSPIQIEANSWNAWFEKTVPQVCTPTGAIQRLVVHAGAKSGTSLEGLEINLHYEIYSGYPVIRKWMEITQRGSRWVKLEKLCIDDLELDAACQQRTLLTPNERGAGSSVVAFGNTNGEYGVISVSEVPSALRHIRDTGAMGYTDALFEWVLGPGETFVSEPVFHFAWQGSVKPTASAVSLPLDRTVEGPFLNFLRKHVGIAADTRIIAAPQWCSWTHFKQNINDTLMREQAKIAARCGFSLVLLDQGWQQGLVGTQPDVSKFPDFAATCQHLQSLGLGIGLWVSCYRSEGSPELKTMPEARSLPLLTRDGGFGMSFAGPWKKFCAEDLAALSRRYGVRYFKQDFTNLKFGDIADGHESRTRKESLLRMLRGLLETQDLLRKTAPDVTAEMTHEIYWGTPGVPCDVAALKHASAYHIPPNDYSGAGPTTGRVRQDKPADVEKLREQLRAGAWHARQRLYEHRGLPLYALEYYAANAVNIRSSLTKHLQERQVCSWLMGVPAVFAGDLASLTPENVAHYCRLFSLAKRLEHDYGIYRNFQFSGVPAPTDLDWHWWGKLTPEGNGAIIILRGTDGTDERAVNIPWVQDQQTYRVHALLSDTPLGNFTGQQLQSGALRLKLQPLGQEILELKGKP